MTKYKSDGVLFLYISLLNSKVSGRKFFFRFYCMCFLVLNLYEPLCGKTMFYI